MFQKQCFWFLCVNITFQDTQLFWHLIYLSRFLQLYYPKNHPNFFVWCDRKKRGSWVLAFTQDKKFFLCLLLLFVEMYNWNIEDSVCLVYRLGKARKEENKKSQSGGACEKKKKEKTRTVSFQPTFLLVEALITWMFRLG